MDPQNNFQMNEGERPSTNRTALIVAVAVVLVVVLWGGYAVLSKKGAGQQAPVAQNQQNQQNQAQGIPQQITLSDIAGKVVKIEGDKMTIEIQSMTSADKLQSDQRVFVIGKDTKIVSVTQKSSKTLKAEQDAYQKQINSKSGTSTSGFIIPPATSITQETTLDKVKVGANVVITSQGPATPESKDFSALVVKFEN